MTDQSPDTADRRDTVPASMAAHAPPVSFRRGWRPGRAARARIAATLRENGRRLLPRLRYAVRAAFAERHLLVRGARRLWAVRLTPRRQAVALAALLAFGAYLALSQAFLLTHASILAGETRRADELERAYRILDEEMNNVLDQMQELQRRLQTSENELNSLTRGAVDLKSSLQATGRRLDTVLVERDSALRDGRVLADRIYQLETRLNTRVRTPKGLMVRLEDRVRTSVDDLEAAIAMTGLKTDRLLEKMPAAPGGLGGPWFAPASRKGADTRPSTSFERHMVRWSQLQQVLGRLPLALPADGAIQSGFGERADPFTGKPALHTGLDLGGQPGQAIRATAAGRVVTAARSGPYGLMVEIDHGMGLATRYAHLRDVAVQDGDRVEAGATIGAMGSTGRSTGTHLHYEILFNDTPLDPARFIEVGRHVFSEVQGGERDAARQ